MCKVHSLQQITYALQNLYLHTCMQDITRYRSYTDQYITYSHHWLTLGLKQICKFSKLNPSMPYCFIQYICVVRWTAFLCTHTHRLRHWWMGYFSAKCISCYLCIHIIVQHISSKTRMIVVWVVKWTMWLCVYKEWDKDVYGIYTHYIYHELTDEHYDWAVRGNKTMMILQTIYVYSDKHVYCVFPRNETRMVMVYISSKCND